MSNKTLLQQFNNASYNPGAGIVKRVLWFLISPISLNSYWPWPMVVKRLILRLFGCQLGKGVVLKPKINIKYPWLLEIGDYSWIGEKVWIDNLVLVRIADNCCLSQGAMLLTGNHNYKKSSFDLITGKIVLDSGVWVGAQATVCPGVKMGNHSLLTVASVLTRPAEAYGIYQGNPAQKVKEREIRSMD